MGNPEDGGEYQPTAKNLLNLSKNIQPQTWPGEF